MKKYVSMFVFFAALIVAAGLFLDGSSPTLIARAGTGDNVSGWAWSENIGWVSFNCTTSGDGSDSLADTCATQDYGVAIDPSTGDFSGYAWSENIGWISFNRADTGDPPSEPFDTGSGPIAQIDWNNNQVSGWARAIAGDDGGGGSGDWAGPFWTDTFVNTPTQTRAQAIDINGNYAYVGGDGGFAIVDITDPQLLVQLSRLTSPEIPDFVTGVRFREINVNKYVFIANYMSGFKILDVSDPLSPIIVGSIPRLPFGTPNAITNEIWDTVISSDNKYAYVSGASSPGGGAVYVIRIEDLNNPEVVAKVNLGGVSPGIGNDIVLVGNYVYVAARKSGIRIVNVSNPLAPTYVGSYDDGFNLGKWAYDIEFESNNGYLYIVKVILWGFGDSQVVVLDISDPENPTEVSSLDIPRDGGNGARAITIDGNLAFVGADEAGIYILDITNPSALTILGNYDGGDWVAWEIGVSGGYAYVTVGETAGSGPDLLVISPDSSDADGWDGWIKLSGDWDGDGTIEWGDTLGEDNPVRFNGVTNEFKGFAWGSDVVGWIDFSPQFGGVVFGAPNQAPVAPTIVPASPSSGLVGVSNDFTVTSTDPDGDQILFRIDWDNDGTVDQFTELVNSDANVPLSYTWDTAGQYTFKVLAEDDKGAQSGWTSHIVNISEPPVCGDGIISGSEECDGSDLGGETCTTQGFTGGGTLSCNPVSCVLDTSNCFTDQCGNGICDFGETIFNCARDCFRIREF